MRKMTKDEFVKRSVDVHGLLYDYSNVEYKTASSIVEIICNIHGSFYQKPLMHIHKKTGCPQCAALRRANARTLSQEEFIIKAKKVHGNTYDYIDCNFTQAIANVRITCRKHGVFEQQAFYHLRGSGCPNCKSSKGEGRIKAWLDSNDINYTQQATFAKCKLKRRLRFDFYLKEYNLCIEFDGEQHFENANLYGKLGKHLKGEELRLRDKIKNEFCRVENIRLLRINYKQMNEIEEILDSNIFREAP